MVMNKCLFRVMFVSIMTIFYTISFSAIGIAESVTDNSAYNLTGEWKIIDSINEEPCNQENDIANYSVQIFQNNEKIIMQAREGKDYPYIQPYSLSGAIDGTKISISGEFISGYRNAYLADIPDALYPSKISMKIVYDSLILSNDCNKIEGDYVWAIKDIDDGEEICASTGHSTFTRKDLAGCKEIKLEECVENWKCSDWEECVNSNQTRICKDINSCSTEKSKPLEYQQCVEESVTEKKQTNEITSSENSQFNYKFVIGIVIAIILLGIVLYILFAKKKKK